MMDSFAAGDKGVSTEPPESALPPGSRLHEYRIEGYLGKGGFGFTYLGFDTQIEQLVAVKEFFPRSLARRLADGSIQALSADTEQAFLDGVDDFINEAKLIARVQQTNVMEVRRYFRLNGTGYIVLRFESGPTLRQALDAGHIDEPRLRSILTGLCNGLSTLHDKAILHRDMKPSNIILSDNRVPGVSETAVIIDFGASRDFSISARESAFAAGASGFAPPEQYQDNERQGPWTDIYGLGATAYTCIAHEPPPDAIARLDYDTIVPAITRGKGAYHPEFLALIDRMLSLDDAKRPQSAEEVRDALSRLPFARIEALSAERQDAAAGNLAASLQLPPKVRQRRTAPLVAFLALLLVLLGAGLGYLWFYQEDTIRELACSKGNLLCEKQDLAFRDVEMCMANATGCGITACGVGYSERFPQSRYQERLRLKLGEAIPVCLQASPQPRIAACSINETPTTGQGSPHAVLADAVLAGPKVWQELIADTRQSPGLLMDLGNLLLGMETVSSSQDLGFEAMYAAAYQKDPNAMMWMGSAYDPTNSERQGQSDKSNTLLALQYYEDAKASCPEDAETAKTRVCDWLAGHGGDVAPDILQLSQSYCKRR